MEAHPMLSRFLRTSVEHLEQYKFEANYGSSGVTAGSQQKSGKWKKKPSPLQKGAWPTLISRMSFFQN